MANGDPVLLGKTGNSTKETKITAITPATEAGLWVQNLGGRGAVVGALQGTALTAGSVGGTAVYAESFADVAIEATCKGSGDVPQMKRAVHGTVPRGAGVHGENTRGRFPEAGVSGSSLSAIGVDGISRTGFGVRGLTRSNSYTMNAGVLGVGAPGHGVVGVATQSFTTPVVGPPFVQGGPLFAGLFQGNVQVQGDFTVTGRKSAIIPHPDGSVRRLYCMESPESWFEDFGTGRLVAGRTVVALDEDFAQLVKAKNYHVFLTPEGDCNGLYVHRKTATGFEVRELKKGSSAVKFSYRIVARRRDVKAGRFEEVQLGDVPKYADEVAFESKPSRKDDEGQMTRELTAMRKRATVKQAVARSKKK